MEERRLKVDLTTYPARHNDASHLNRISWVGSCIPQLRALILVP